MFEDEFTQRDSFFHRLDPRIKIVVVFLFSVIAAVANRFVVLWLALGFSLVIVLMSRTPIRQILRRLVPVNLFVLFLWFFLPFTLMGRPLFSIGPLVFFLAW